MLFKVVKCIRGGKFTFAIVPDNWERDGTLQWPRKHKFGKLTLGEILHPGKEWIEVQCVVAKKDIQTYKDADRVFMKKDPNSREKTNDKDRPLGTQNEKIPPDNSSHEQDEMNTDPLRLLDDSCGGNSNASSLASLAKDVQANNALVTDNIKETELVKTSNLRKATSIIPYIVDTSGGDTNIIFELNAENTDMGEVSSLLPFSVSNSTNEAETSKLSDSANYSKIDCKAEHMKENNNINKKLDDLTAKVSTILENQTIMSLNQASLSNMFDKFMRATGCSFAVNEVKKTNMDFDVIQTAEDLISFEEKLDDPAFRENLTKKFAIISKRADGHGTTVAYKLVDLMFTRAFLTQCSWSGGSRDDMRKVCFKMFHRTRDFFLNIVRSKDHLFTMEDSDEFFKKILKNSNKRNTHLNLRTPSQRRKRMKKLYTAQLYKDDSESEDGERETVETLIETAMTIEEE